MELQRFNFFNQNELQQYVPIHLLYKCAAAKQLHHSKEMTFHCKRESSPITGLEWPRGFQEV